MPLGYSFEILKQALYMIFKMTAPIKFELSPRGTLNSLKFAHEQPRDVNQCWKSFLYKIRQLMIAFLATSGRCKRARAADRPFFNGQTWNQTQSLVPTIWN